MKQSQKYKNLNVLLLSLIGGMLVIACNGGNSTSTTQTSNSPLAEYKSMLTYTPAGQQQIKVTSNNQQSFTVTTDTTFTSIDIKFFSNNSCNSESGGLKETITLNGSGGVTFPAGTYTSTGAANYALCGRYSTGGCEGLYDAFTNNQVQSMRFDYNYAASSGGPGTVGGICMAGSTDSSNKEAVLNWSSGSSPWAKCTESANCGFSQAYNLNLPGSVPLVTSYSLVGGGVISSGGEVYGLAASTENLYAAEKTMSTFVKVVPLSSPESSWGSIAGTNTATTIRLAYDLTGSRILISRTNGNVAYSTGSGTPTLINGFFRFGNNVGSNVNANVLGLAFVNNLVYAYAPDRTATPNFASNMVSGGTSWSTTESNLPTTTNSLYVVNGTRVYSSLCYGSAYSSQSGLYEGGCSGVESAIYLNGQLINASSPAPAAIRSMVFANGNLFIGVSNGMVYKVVLNQ